MYARRHTVALTTDASGDVTAYSEPANGRLHTIRYAKTDFADGVDFTVTLESTGEAVWAESNVNASATRAPRQATHGVDGTASLYAAAGEPVEGFIVAAGDRFKVVVAQGGNVKSGALHFIVG